MNTSEEKYRDLFRSQLDDNSPEEFREELWLEALAKLEADDVNPVAAPFPNSTGAQRPWGKWGLILLLLTTIGSLAYLFWSSNNVPTKGLSSNGSHISTSEMYVDNNDDTGKSGVLDNSANGRLIAENTGNSSDESIQADNVPFEGNKAKANSSSSMSNPVVAEKPSKQQSVGTSRNETMNAKNTASKALANAYASKNRNLKSAENGPVSAKNSNSSPAQTANTSPKGKGNQTINESNNSTGLPTSIPIFNSTQGGTGLTNNLETNNNQPNPNTSIAESLANTDNPKNEFAYLNSINSVWGQIEFEKNIFGPVLPPSNNKTARRKGWEFGLLLGSGAEFGNSTYANSWAAASIRYNFSGMFGLQVAPGGVFHAGSQGIERTSRVEVYSFDSTGTSQSYRSKNAILLELPLLFHYRPHNKHGLFAGAGASYLLNSQSDIYASQTDGSFRQTTAWGYNPEHGNVGTFARVGYEWRFSKHIHLHLSGQREFVLQSVAPWSVRLGLQWKIK